MLYQRVHGALPPEPHLADRLNGLAYRLACLGGLYAIGGKHSAPRRLSREEVARGYFRNGARELHFLDERAPILQIGVTQESIERAARALLTAGDTADAGAQQ